MARCINCGKELVGPVPMPLWSGTDEGLCTQCHEKYDRIKSKIYTTGVYDRSGFMRKYEDFLKSNGFTENGINYIADYYTTKIIDGQGGQGVPIGNSTNYSIKATLKDEIYTVEPKSASTDSPAATFCKVLGVLTWLGGLILVFEAAKAGGLYAIITPLISYGIAGGVMFCVAELLQNVKRIADALQGMKVFGDKHKE